MGRFTIWGFLKVYPGRAMLAPFSPEENPVPPSTNTS